MIYKFVFPLQFYFFQFFLANVWIGYTWNTELIESPKKLLNDLHERGVRVALNLHPADGKKKYIKKIIKFILFL